MENDYNKKMKSISILGIYVADLAFFGKSIPVAGETLLGEKIGRASCRERV